MSLPFDATAQDLLRYISDWLTRLNVAVGGLVEEVAADLSTVTALADKVFRIAEATPWLLHLELQASRDVNLARRLLKYNCLLHDRFLIPVHTIAVLLRREADGAELTGLLSYGPRPELGGLRFAYRVVRVWEWQVEEVLRDGLGTLPLAPLSQQVTRATLPEIVHRIDDRLRREGAPLEAATLWTATYVLLGLRFSDEIVTEALQGAGHMEESVTYQAIVRRGRLQELRLTILRQGRKRFGPADGDTETALANIMDLERLQRMSERLLDAASWQELLQST